MGEPQVFLKKLDGSDGDFAWNGIKSYIWGKASGKGSER
jgi:hypothetical protein